MGGVTRRELLASTVSLPVFGLIGCSGTLSGEATPAPTSAIRSTASDGADLLVVLREGERIERLTLVGPDGEVVATRAVEPGVTRVRLPLLEIASGSGLDHYRSGIHQLVAVADGPPTSQALDLRPAPHVVEITQHRSGYHAIDLGRLAITVENRGTGPTWLYDVVYRDAPNPTAADELAPDPGVPRLLAPTGGDTFVLGPHERLTVVGAAAPLLFDAGSGSPTCSGSVEFDVVVGVAVGAPLETRVRTRLGGESLPAGFTGEYVCSAVVVDRLGGGAGG